MGITFKVYMNGGSELSAVVFAPPTISSASPVSGLSGSLVSELMVWVWALAAPVWELPVSQSGRTALRAPGMPVLPVFSEAARCP